MKLLRLTLLILLLGAGCKDDPEEENIFYKNWDISPKEGAFKMDDWIVWGGSVIKAEDGKYYMFASRWPEKLSMRAWVTNSEVVLAKADNPEGPYQFKKVILPARGKEFWDGMATHNPTIRYHNGKYILFYVGVNYDFKQPVDSIPTRAMYEEAWNTKRIGIAVADSPYGPWERKDEPVLLPRPGKWDGVITSNPAPVVHDDGSVLLIYKSAPVPYPERNQNRTMRFGVAKAKHYSGTYERIEENNQIEIKPVDTDVEDPYVWFSDNKYYMLAKCMNDSITGEKGAGFLASSGNGIEWKISENPVAYSRTVELSDGTKREMAKLERPQVLFENGKPTHVFFATRNEEDEIFNMVRPLKTGFNQSNDSEPYDGTWEALQKMPVPSWFNDGKIGIFIHWGPYSVVGYRKGDRGYAEWVPTKIYEDPEHYYPYLEQRWGAKPPEFGYKDIIPEFKAENWNPEEWAELFEEVGARYVVLTAEHHDGWANWDSDLTPWNAMDMGPERDLVGDLGKALRSRGLKYAPSFHRERHTSFFTTERYVVNAKPHPDIVEEIKRVPEAELLYGPFGFSKEAVDEYVARWKEIQEKYQPDMMWIDDIPIFTRDGNDSRKNPPVFKPEIQYLYDQCRLMITDFMNNGAANGQAVYVNNKGKNRNWPDGIGCLERDNLNLKVIGPKWQSCTTFGTSYGYLEGDTYKSIEDVIHEMVEVISKNGNFLINIGPKADGTLVPEQVVRLKSMGEWLKINGDAIYGSRYWKVSQQENEHLSFTTNGKKLYAIKCDRTVDSFIIEATSGWDKKQIKSVSLLGSDSKVDWEMTADGLRITPPENLGKSKYAWSFEIITKEEQHHPNAIQTDVDKAFEGKKGET